MKAQFKNHDGEGDLNGDKCMRGLPLYFFHKANCCKANKNDVLCQKKKKQE